MEVVRASSVRSLHLSECEYEAGTKLEYYLYHQEMDCGHPLPNACNVTIYFEMWSMMDGCLHGGIDQACPCVGRCTAQANPMVLESSAGRIDGTRSGVQGTVRLINKY